MSILDQLISSDKEPRAPRQTPTSPSGALAFTGAPHVDSTTAVLNVRSMQVKAAVRPSEKDVFERLAILKKKSVSDLIRDLLWDEAVREGLIEAKTEE